MSVTDRIRSALGRPRKQAPAGYPQVVARISKDADYQPPLGGLRALSMLPASFPFEYFNIIDAVAITDPYISKFVYTTVALGNPGHKLFIQAPSESRADEAITVANNFAARCFPFGGGMDGVVNGLFNQLARCGALCVEWVPDKSFNRIERGFLVPIKTLRFRYADDQGTIELVQLRQDGKLVPLQPLQTTYHGLALRDTNPYPIPPIVSALEAVSSHKAIMAQIRVWMEKVSSLGVLLAEVEPPPREANETQADYDTKAGTYLQKIADSIINNLKAGLGVAYNNLKFTFQSTQAGAQGARELLQLVLQSMFAALQRDPIMFGWNFGSTETLASIVYEDMKQGLKVYQLGAKRAIEHGHRLNLALNGMGDVGLSMRFKKDQAIDPFKESQAAQMDAQSLAIQVENGFCTVEEARRALRWEDKKVEAGAYVATFNKGTNRYVKAAFERSSWSVGYDNTDDGEVHEEPEAKDGNPQQDGERQEDLHPGTLRERTAQIRAVT